MIKKSIEYLPSFLNEIEEYKQIFNAGDTELSNVYDVIENIVKETIVQTAENYGLQQYEKIYNLSNSFGNVSERRFNIQTKMISQLPFNLEWLNNKLTSLVGENGYTINLNRNTYSLTIYVSHIFLEIANELNDTLRKEIPANLVLTINLFKAEEISNYTGCFIHKGSTRYYAYNA